MAAYFFDCSYKVILSPLIFNRKTIDNARHGKDAAELDKVKRFANDPSSYKRRRRCINTDGMFSPVFRWSRCLFSDSHLGYAELPKSLTTKGMKIA